MIRYRSFFNGWFDGEDRDEYAEMRRMGYIDDDIEKLK